MINRVLKQARKIAKFKLYKMMTASTILCEIETCIIKFVITVKRCIRLDKIKNACTWLFVDDKIYVSDPENDIQREHHLLRTTLPNI